MTILLGYNTPISGGLQGTAYTPYLNRRGAVSQKQAGYLGDGAAGRDDIIHQSDMESLHGKFKLKGIFQVLPALAGIERMLDGAGSLASQAFAMPDASSPAG